MKRSLNEVEGGLKKATLGAGWPVGTAEDMSRAGVLMCGAGHDGVGLALDALSQPKQGDRRIEDAIAHLGGSSIIAEATAAFDLLGAGVVSEARFGRVDQPALLAALAFVAGTDQGCGFELSANGTTFDLGTSQPDPGATIVATRSEAPHGKGTELAEVSDADWQAVQTLVAKTFVPASAESRLGAGSTLTDND